MDNETRIGTAKVQVKSFNKDDRTVEVRWATGAAVKRHSYEIGPFHEELSMKESSIRLGRARSGAMSLLDTHESYEMKNRIGVVLGDSIRIEKGKAYATVQLSRHGVGENLLKDLEDGLPFAVSVGYRIYSYEETDGSDDTLPKRVITDWEPLELSAVPIPADPGATSRANPTQESRQKMSKPNKIQNPPSIVPSYDEVQIMALAEMTKLAEEFGEDFVRSAINDRKSYDEFREMVIDKLTEEDAKVKTSHHVRMDVPSQSRHYAENRAMEDALVARFIPDFELTGEARTYKNASLIGIARAFVERTDSSARMGSNNEVAKRAMATGDFPNLLGNVLGRALQSAYQAAPAALKRTGKKTTIDDFRPRHALAYPESPALETVDENGEFRHGFIKEAKNSYALGTLGKILKFTRQAMVNDDLGAFENINRIMVTAAGVTEAKALTDLLLSNPAMGDGVALFHANHSNLGTAAALSTASLSDGRLKLRKQTGVGGGLINVTPKYLVVGPNIETPAEQVLAQIAAAKVSDVNPFAGQLELVVEPRITDNRWYVVADPVQVPGLEYAYLTGEDGPVVETKNGFEVDAVEFKVRLDFGCGFTDHRGWYFNPGV